MMVDGLHTFPSLPTGGTPQGGNVSKLRTDLCFARVAQLCLRPVTPALTRLARCPRQVYANVVGDISADSRPAAGSGDSDGIPLRRHDHSGAHVDAPGVACPVR